MPILGVVRSRVMVTGDDTPKVSAIPEPAGDVLLVSGRGQLQAYPVPGDSVVIGRASDCDVVIDHEGLSRHHCVLQRNPLSIQDLGSTNGTRLARGMIRNERVALAGGEAFFIGPFSFMVVASRSSEPSSHRSGADRLLVEDPTPHGISGLVRDIARSNVNVLIQGETGVGKEVLATTLHELSGRSGPLTRINCAALSETLLESELFGHEKGAFTGAVASKTGLLEAARTGSVFLDELGELPLGIQAKLLRAVEMREILPIGSTRTIAIDVRFITATNRDLPTEVSAGRFRHDLYFRLDGVTLTIPPLRERPGAIAMLAMSFIAEASRRLGHPSLKASPELLAALRAHDWPGNVRELKSVIERAVLLARGKELGARHISFSPRSKPATPEAPAKPARSEPGFLGPAQRAERDRIVAALEECGGNQTRAAKLLGVGRTTLVSRLALYRLTRPRR